ncbi:MAG TPA: Flp pilus assembly protein CpaB [Planctomycetaceae bacterium]|nr:Flp pilus assembly protein CpaB [Planctomycetaceae bacterium]
MRSKPIILLVTALGCGMVAAVAASKAVLSNGGSAQGEQSVEIFVAVKDLKQGQKIAAESVRVEKWPKSRVPEGAQTDLEMVESKFTNQMIFAGEPIVERKLADSRDSFSTTIPQGYSVFDIAGGTSSGYIKPGDRVDILGTFQLGDRHSAPETRTVMRNVKIHGINGITTRDSDEVNAVKNTTFQLLVKETQLETLTLAYELANGKLRLNLLPFGESEEREETDNGQDFLDWVSDNEQPEQSLLTSAASTIIDAAAAAPAPAADEGPKHELLVITPHGVQRYQWKDLNGLPERVEDALTPNGPTAGGTGNSNGDEGNESEGYGGYGPTYPTDEESAALLEGALSEVEEGDMPIQ